jgi:hypothetical protein
MALIYSSAFNKRITASGKPYHHPSSQQSNSSGGSHSGSAVRGDKRSLQSDGPQSARHAPSPASGYNSSLRERRKRSDGDQQRGVGRAQEGVHHSKQRSNDESTRRHHPNHHQHSPVSTAPTSDGEEESEGGCRVVGSKNDKRSKSHHQFQRSTTASTVSSGGYDEGVAGGGGDGPAVRKMTAPGGYHRDRSSGRKISTPAMSVSLHGDLSSTLSKSASRLVNMRKALAKKRLTQIYGDRSSSDQDVLVDVAGSKGGEGGVPKNRALARCVELHQKFSAYNGTGRRRSISLDTALRTGEEGGEELEPTSPPDCDLPAAK